MYVHDVYVCSYEWPSDNTFSMNVGVGTTTSTTTITRKEQWKEESFGGEIGLNLHTYKLAAAAFLI